MHQILCIFSIKWNNICRKQLKKGVLIHIHVNLAVALLLSLLIFMFGVDLASDIEVGFSVLDGINILNKLNYWCTVLFVYSNVFMLTSPHTDTHTSHTYIFHIHIYIYIYIYIHTTTHINTLHTHILAWNSLCSIILAFALVFNNELESICQIIPMIINLK